MYAWKCWRETRASFIFLLMMSTALALLVTFAPGLKEQNGWWRFDRSEYLHNPWPTTEMVTIEILTGLGALGFLSALFFGATASGSEIEPGTIEYLWTRPRTRTSVAWTHWGVCLAEMLIVALVPIYLAAAILGTLTKHWQMPLLLLAPWIIFVVGLPVLGLTTLMTALRRSGKGGLLGTAGVATVYVIVRQIITVPLHLNLPPLFAGPLVWLMNSKPFVPMNGEFPWGSLWRGIFLAAAFPLAAQYLLKRAEV
jgi:ABC-type transport system involved in multi-copper enzyme maturation permease subunit